MQVEWTGSRRLFDAAGSRDARLAVQDGLGRVVAVWVPPACGAGWISMSRLPRPLGIAIGMATERSVTTRLKTTRLRSGWDEHGWKGRNMGAARKGQQEDEQEEQEQEQEEQPGQPGPQGQQGQGRPLGC